MKKHLIFFAIAVVVGCSKEKGPPGAGAGGPPKMEMQVVAVDARMQPVSEKISLVGNVMPNESVELKSEIDGTVVEINFKEGERVEKGTSLVRLDERKLSAMASAAEADFKMSETTFERTKQLFRDKLVSQQEYDQASATFQARQANLELQKQLLRDARIIAPFAGIAGARMISPGQVIAKNTTLTWLVDLDIVKVEVNVPERYLQKLKIGQPLEFSVAAFGDQKFQGEVYFISPQINESLRTALVKARIQNKEGKLRGGMFASLNLTLQVRDSAIVIPEPALMSNGDNFSVFVVDEKGTAQMRPVQIGLRLAGKAEVIKGLNAGEKVVVEGVQKLRPGASVKLAPEEAMKPYTGS